MRDGFDGGQLFDVREPKFLGWLTTDAEEIGRRKWRGRTEPFEITNREPEHGHFGTFEVRSESGRIYSVEIRDLRRERNSCTCRDFETCGLGTCKHIEAVLYRLHSRDGTAYRSVARIGSGRIEVYLSADGMSVMTAWPAQVETSIENQSRIEALTERLESGRDVTEALAEIRDVAAEQPRLMRVSCLLERWAGEWKRARDADYDRTAFLDEVKSGHRNMDLLRFPLFPYQRDGMLHLAFGERALLADEMGLGKTVQALAACTLLRELKSVERVLVVSPASLKSEWAEQIEAATDLPWRIVSGRRELRLDQYRSGTFFTLTNYEQVLSDIDDIQRLYDPDIVILDEAQRIKNWRTKTASAIKRLRSRYAFVLTGTPLENRIDELWSIVQYLDPKLLGPLFRFNRDYYRFDERGRPTGYQNLDELSRRVQPVMLRRRKDEVEDELPARTLNNYFLDMTEEQQKRYQDHEYVVARIARIAERRPLTPAEFKRMQTGLACMRMTCDTPYIMDPEVRDCPKLEELERVLEDLLADQDCKVIVFSEWVRMLELVKERLEELDLDFAWHTGSVPQDRRRAEINRFKRDPRCRLFLSSESGGTGLNLQVASAVINLDLPWNPAKLEQRIARAWRKNQTRPVTVINMVTRDSIEHRMLGLIDFKQALADTVLDGRYAASDVKLSTGRAAFLERLEQVMGQDTTEKPRRDDPVESTLESLRQQFESRLHLVELRKTESGKESMLVVLQDGELPAEPFETGEGPPVEFITRESLETIRKLEAQGLLSFRDGDVRVLHKAEEVESNPVAVRREEALRLLEGADRQYRMATLLAGGGFAAEALPRIAEMTTMCLQALATLSPAEGAGAEDSETAAEICDRLGGQDILPTNLRFKALWLSEAESGVEEEAQALEDATGLLSHVKSAIAA